MVFALCGSARGLTHNHIQLAQLLAKINQVHKTSLELRYEPVPSGKNFEGELEQYDKILRKYDRLWEQLRVILMVDDNEGAVDAAAELVEQERQVHMLLNDVAEYAHENTDEIIERS